MMKISTTTLLLLSLALLLRSGQSEVVCEGGSEYLMCTGDEDYVCYDEPDQKIEDDPLCKKWQVQDNVIHPPGVKRRGDGAPNKIEIGAGFGGNSGVVIGGTDPDEVITHDPILGGVKTVSRYGHEGSLEFFYSNRRQLRRRTSTQQQGEQQR
uniref:Uncharacterized protein n=1 Tax=Grammatophora oceanica TaxID=210454 RepID=A0A6U5K1B8_9STRA|mmetsp:Transcript_27649/g.40651  ORF Transcript_27649/g.40651 Transcript_27649/m.40651 type:complete len:153 (+) Transcript_27649:79-537(+)